MTQSNGIFRGFRLPEDIDRQLTALADRDYEGNYSQALRAALRGYFEKPQGRPRGPQRAVAPAVPENPWVAPVAAQVAQVPGAAIRLTDLMTALGIAPGARDAQEPDVLRALRLAGLDHRGCDLQGNPIYYRHTYNRVARYTDGAWD